jgi:hypothetical protein
LPDSEAIDSTSGGRKPPEAGLDQFVACFEGLKDPRTGNAGLHDLHELLVIALCTVLSGGQGATHMAAYAVAKEPFLRGFLKLKNGLPSHDTFSRLFRLLDPAQFRAVFQRFMARFAETVQGVVAIDGKVLRRSFDRASGKSALHMVRLDVTHECVSLAWALRDARIPPMDYRHKSTRKGLGCTPMVGQLWKPIDTHERGSGQNSSRQRPTQFGRAAPHGAERHAEGHHQRIFACKFMRAGWDDRYLARLLALF